MLVCETARVNLHSSLDVIGKSECFPDDSTRALQKRRRPTAPVKLHDFAPWIDKRAHLHDFFFEMIQVGLSPVMVTSDDGRATTIPTERFTKRYVKVQRKVALAAIVLKDSIGKLRPAQIRGELGRRRVRGVARSHNVVLLYQIEIDFKTAHTLATVSLL